MRKNLTIIGARLAIVAALTVIPALLALVAQGDAGAAARDTQIGVGSSGPISPQAIYEIERMIEALPHTEAVPIQPAGGVEATVKRFVAGDPEDKLDGVIVVSLPEQSFKAQRDGKSAKFTGTYEIWTLNLTTLEEDRHDFKFTDQETVLGGVTALLAIPAQLLTERTTGNRLISGNVWQAYQTVRIRVESKLLAATRLYLTNAPIRRTPRLDPLQCARRLIDRGSGDLAMKVFRSVGVEKPIVKRMIVAAREKLRRHHAHRLLGRTLGAMAGGSSKSATTILKRYEKDPAAEHQRIAMIRSAIASVRPPQSASGYEKLLKSDVPKLEHSAFVAMLKQLFVEQTGSIPADVVVGKEGVKIQDKKAPQGLKTSLDRYAAALARAAWLMSLRCGCDAGAALTGGVTSPVLLSAHAGPSFARAQVGLP